MPGVKRALTGTTPLDKEIDELPIPEDPAWLVLVVKGLRWYRHAIAPRLGNRCVFEPSCSRYSELAFRKYGFLRGMILSARRLYHCRPGLGGRDLP
ncbi:MAG: membrane protein insertion efficiency factor YidD [Chloroflexi bacterium]|nr:MAG: membrane protein insertion efficiency factor YidD [Chloroflexota bacterium]